MPSCQQENDWLEERLTEKIEALEKRVLALETIILKSKPLTTEDEGK